MRVAAVRRSPRSGRATLTAAEAPAPYDVVLAGGRIVDGTGAPWFRGDIGIVGDRIAAIGELGRPPADHAIERRGLVVAPGFIDLLGQSEFNVLVDSRAASKITPGHHDRDHGRGRLDRAGQRPHDQGGSATAYQHFGVEQDWRTLDEYFRRIERARSAVNIGTFVGSGGLRDYVIGQGRSPGDRGRARRDEALVAQAMEHGALGVSSSLQYVPNRFASTDELVELAKVAARYGGIYFTHQRSEGTRIVRVARRGVRDRRAREHPRRDLAPQDRVQGQLGQDAGGASPHRSGAGTRRRVSANIYPYNRASNGLDACLPLWAREGGTEAMLARLTDPATRERIKKDMDDPNATVGEPVVRRRRRRTG